MKKKCPGCNIQLKDVRKAFDPHRAMAIREDGFESAHGDFFYDYPKSIRDPGMNKTFNEYRFVCRKCKKEWVYDSLFRQFDYVPHDSQYRFSWKYNALIPRKFKK